MSGAIGRGNNKPAHAKKTIERIMGLEASDFNSLSIEFSLVCIGAKISLCDAAKYLGVTRGAVYRWSKGNKIREERRPAVREFMTRLKQDLNSGELPKANRIESARYIESLLTAKQ